MYDYDKFALSAASLTTTATALGLNGSGTVTPSAHYRMRLSGLNISNTGTTIAVATLQKVFGTLPAVVIFQQNLAAAGSPDSTVTLGEDQDFVIETGYYVQAVMSVGTGSVFAEGEFILE